MIHHFRIHFKNRSHKMEELPSQMGGDIYIKRLVLGGGDELGGNIPNSD